MRAPLAGWLLLLAPHASAAALMHAPPRPLMMLQPHQSLRNTPPISMKSLTDESIEAITEIVLRDMQMVLKTARDDFSSWSTCTGSFQAFDLAKESAERRSPMLAYLVEYKALKLKLSALEAAISSARVVAPWTVDDLSHEIALEGMRLARHKRKLRLALKELTPVVKGRLLQTARERPALIPSLSSGLVRSGFYKLRWRLNKWFVDRQLRSEEVYERTRSILVDKWLARTVELHRMANPSDTISTFMRTKPRITKPRQQRSASTSTSSTGRPLVPSRLAAPVRRVLSDTWVHGVALWFLTRRATVLVAFASITCARRRWQHSRRMGMQNTVVAGLLPPA